MNKNNVTVEKLIFNYLAVTTLLLIGIGLFLNPLQEVYQGLINIVTAPGVLLTDHFEIGGAGASLVNSGLCLLVALIFLKSSKAHFSGITLAAMFIYLGFTFFGKSVLNILPIFLGVKIFSMYINEPMKNYIHLAIFATCLAPLVSVNFLGGIPGVLVGIILGIIYGFIIVPVGQNALKFHRGFTLYNIGFSGGLCALVAAAIIRSLGYDLTGVNIVSDDYATLLLVLLVVYSIGTIILGFSLKDFTLKEYLELLARPGQAVTDFFLFHNPGIVFINVGLMGLLTTLVALIAGVPLNGPIFGAIITNIGFAAFGKNPRNSLPLIIGASLMFFLTGTEVTTGVVLTLIFATCLAPIAGQYGILAGILAGILHYSIVSFTSSWQGALNLYNNGFASGIVAGFLVNIFDVLKKTE